MVDADAKRARIAPQRLGRRRDIREVIYNLVRQLLRERIAARLLVELRARQRVRKHRHLELLSVRRRFLDLHERVGCHHRRHRLVACQPTLPIANAICLVLFRLDSAEHVAWVDDKYTATDLAEAEGSLTES